MQLAIEIDRSQLDEVTADEDRHYWRRLVRALWTGLGDLPDGETVVEETCEDADEWHALAEGAFDSQVLWDDDWCDDQFDDMEPETAERLKHRFDIPEDYYCEISPDPKRSQLPALLARMECLIAAVPPETRFFCDGFVPRSFPPADGVDLP